MSAYEPYPDENADDYARGFDKGFTTEGKLGIDEVHRIIDTESLDFKSGLSMGQIARNRAKE